MSGNPINRMAKSKKYHSVGRQERSRSVRTSNILLPRGKERKKSWVERNEMDQKKGEDTRVRKPARPSGRRPRRSQKGRLGFDGDESFEREKWAGKKSR
ncbi:hypothetical protein Nepgr_021382 [Nepenthes gracilis]|uniref:Uncharacterized protein n=1 Tax=Nepenthes gracilis TaxID=150966 RepID=A0AAD3SYX8_NEPGR|nr:hypothetical protein Nepgr_021382 [Nepenthes gracilis]